MLLAGNIALQGQIDEEFEAMPTQPLSRRRFLKTAGLTAVSAALAGSGLGYAATPTPTVTTP